MVSLLLIVVSAAQECGGTCSFNSIVCIIYYKNSRVQGHDCGLSLPITAQKIMCT